MFVQSNSWSLPNLDVMIPVRRRITDVYTISSPASGFELWFKGTSRVTVPFSSAKETFVPPDSVLILYVKYAGASVELLPSAILLLGNRAEASNGLPGANTDATQKDRQAVSNPKPTKPVLDIPTCRNK